jgi:CRISPR-associated exonuclease Cas4
MDDELIPISALTHYAYCPRRCALVHIEQIWTENRFTAEGRIMHEHVHEEGNESRGNVRIERGASLRSLRLGLIGKADVVEYHRQADGTWQAFPVEHKRGKPKPDHSDKIQLCAQALCLEEMLNATIPAGALFYGKTRRRLDVDFNEALRLETQNIAQQTHALIESGQTPKPVYAKRCESCSLMAECMPKTMQKKRSVESYLKRMLDEKDTPAPHSPPARGGEVS